MYKFTEEIAELFAVIIACSDTSGILIREDWPAPSETIMDEGLDYIYTQHPQVIERLFGGPPSGTRHKTFDVNLCHFFNQLLRNYEGVKLKRREGSLITASTYNKAITWLIHKMPIVSGKYWKCKNVEMN